MAVPSDPDTVGWYEFSARPGAPGNVVLAGHVDWGGRLRAFGLLRLLHTDDAVVVSDSLGRELTYHVRETEVVDPDSSPMDVVGQRGASEELTLITCGGAFDRASHQYLKRVVVRALRDDSLVP
jgi:LPXTG-site transpeptidase (sortase) family protein